MKIGFIGAGKVGCSLGKYFVENGIPVTGFHSRSLTSAAEAAAFTGTACFETAESLIAASDAVFLTVPDGEITAVYREIRGLLRGKRVCHCSGSLPAAEAFPETAGFGIRGCSVHPLYPVSSRFEAWKTLGEAFFCIEGEDAADWCDLLHRLGNPTRQIASEGKAQYHAACSVASNLVCALMAESCALLEGCGFTAEEARAALRPLAMSNLRRILEVGAVEALTGPIERNDTGTVAQHLACLPEGAGRELYRAGARRLIDIAEQRHPEGDFGRMRDVLAGA